MKRMLAVLLAGILVLSLAANAFAEDDSLTFAFKLTSNGSSIAAVEVGKTLTVEMYILRTDSTADYQIYGLENHIQFDREYLEFVEGSILVSEQGFVVVHTPAGEITANFISLNPDKEAKTHQAEILIGTFQLKALKATANATNVSNAAYYMTTSGAGLYESTAQNLAVTITAGGAGNGDNGGNSGNGGSGGSSGGSGGQIAGEGTGTPPSQQEILEPDTPLNNPDFSDVPQDHWAYQYVTYLREKGFVTGKTATLFAPGDPITRAEFITMLARMSGEQTPASYSGAFVDVAAGSYYEGAVAWGVAAGIVKGTSETTYSPNNPILRQEIATMIVRYAAYREFNFLRYNQATDFTDSAQIHEYARGSVSVMQQADIINGYEDGGFGPLRNATRAEVAKMLALVHYMMENAGERL